MNPLQSDAVSCHSSGVKSWQSMIAVLLAAAPVACDRGDPGQAKGHEVAAGAEKPAQGFGELTVEQVAARIGTPGVYIFDNNHREEWVRGHVPTATWVDYGTMTTADLPADKNATLIFYCANEH